MFTTVKNRSKILWKYVCCCCLSSKKTTQKEPEVWIPLEDVTEPISLEIEIPKEEQPKPVVEESAERTEVVETVSEDLGQNITEADEKPNSVLDYVGDLPCCKEQQEAQTTCEINNQVKLIEAVGTPERPVEIIQETNITSAEYPDPAIMKRLATMDIQEIERLATMDIQEIISYLKVAFSKQTMDTERIIDTDRDTDTQKTEYPVPAIEESLQNREPVKKESTELAVPIKDAVADTDSGSESESDSESDSESESESDSESDSDNKPKFRHMSLILADRHIYFKAKLEKAIRKKKIFWLLRAEHIDESMRRRGWIQKISFTFDAKARDSRYLDPDSGLELKLSYSVKPSLIWSYQHYPYSIVEPDQMMNSYTNTDCFTTKFGLCVNLKNGDKFFPRCYDLADKKGRMSFTDDFMKTAAYSIIKWVVRRNSTPVQAEETTRNGCVAPISVNVILMAFMVCKMFMIPSVNKDIDKTIEEMDPDWTEYLEGYYQLIHAGAEIRNSATYADPCRQVLDKIQAKLPQLDIDTGRNIWILKRAALSRGRDIVCMDRLKKIITFVESHDSHHVEKKWVIQKYIERPFLIYNTKFDMRQFFLVTAWNPLTIWYYKENYICMSSQPFNLENLDNSIHLCNRAVQMQFKNCPTRHPELPEDNVWSNRKLQEYLCMIGAENVWEDVMVPGIKKIIYQTMQVSQNKVTHRKNSFDIYGADFMFSENFNPWLIEINSRPDMSSPTAVTGVIFESILEDTIKVIIDRKKDPNCDIGAYELIQKQP